MTAVDEDLLPLPVLLKMYKDCCNVGSGQCVTSNYRKTRMLPEAAGAPAVCSTEPASLTVHIRSRSSIACAHSCNSHPSCASFNQNCQDNSCFCDLYTYLPMSFAVVPNCQHWNKWLEEGLVRCTDLYDMRTSLKTLKGRMALNNLRVTERHLPYWITPCYLLPDTSERAPP